MNQQSVPEVIQGLIEIGAEITKKKTAEWEAQKQAEWKETIAAWRLVEEDVRVSLPASIRPYLELQPDEMPEGFRKHPENYRAPKKYYDGAIKIPGLAPIHIRMYLAADIDLGIWVLGNPPNERQVDPYQVPQLISTPDDYPPYINTNTAYGYAANELEIALLDARFIYEHYLEACEIYEKREAEKAERAGEPEYIPANEPVFDQHVYDLIKRYHDRLHAEQDR